MVTGTLSKADLLATPVEHLDIKLWDPRPMVDGMGKMSFQARNLHRAACIYDQMLADRECGIILTLAGSLVSAGLRQVLVDLLNHNMVDAIVSSGANIADQDFFEALGFRHYAGTPGLDDEELRQLGVDRIFDTYIDEDQLRISDQTLCRIADGLMAGPYSSRAFIQEMGRYLAERDLGENSIIRTAFEKQVPIFCPAFSDCSAGFGLIMHQSGRRGRCVTLDSARDFLELTHVKSAFRDSGLLMIGGGCSQEFCPGYGGCGGSVGV